MEESPATVVQESDVAGVSLVAVCAELRLGKEVEAARASLEERAREREQERGAREEGSVEAAALCEELKLRCDELAAERAQRVALSEHLAATRLEARVCSTSPSVAIAEAAASCSS